jgi:gamma-glutamylcyclotransferase (GGCT)/AIG2-like uncharacterized protein YtfP
MNYEHIIFVYGTLKKNCVANDMLRESQYLGTAITKPLYQLYSCGSYPALVACENGSNIQGEIYGISDEQKKRLDIYEGVAYGLYEFKKIELYSLNIVGFESVSSILDIKAYFFLGDLNSWQKITSWTCSVSY